MTLDQTTRGITKEMWTVVIPVSDGVWDATDIICNSEAACIAMFDLIRRNVGKKLDGGRVTKCIVTIYPPE